MAMFEMTNPRARVPACLRCESLNGDVELDFRRELMTRKAAVVDGFLCRDERACRRRARARGLPDLNFCYGCDVELVPRDKAGRRPERCRSCSVGLDGQYAAVGCESCQQEAPAVAYLQKLDGLWVCRDVSACHRRMMRPRLRLLPGGARY